MREYFEPQMKYSKEQNKGAKSDGGVVAARHEPSLTEAQRQKYVVPHEN